MEISLNRLKSNLRNLLSIVSLVGLVSCSHGLVVQEFPETASSSDEIQKLEADVASASKAQVDVLAPQNFKGAEKSLASAQEKQNKGKDSKDVLHEVAQGRAYLSRANEAAQLGNTNLQQVVAARQRAIDAGSKQYLAEGLQEADESLTKVTSDIEKNDLSSVEKNASKLQAKYLELEVKSIQQAHLGFAREILQQAKNEGASEFAPRSLALAEIKIKDTHAFIVANREKTEEIKVQSKEAQDAAEHLLNITRKAKVSERTSPEEIALQLESVKSLADSKQLQVKEEREALKAYVEQNQGLEQEKAFNKRFEEARSEFRDDEAEVYRQGNQLLIRLKGLKFPVARAALQDSHFPLLTKVNKVIKSFGKSSILIEGHTDSDGSKAVNEKLSAERAKAVKAYLLSASQGEDLDIESVGRGFQRPLASNKTPSGKAQNRRIDIILTPAGSSADQQQQQQQPVSDSVVD